MSRSVLQAQFAEAQYQRNCSWACKEAHRLCCWHGIYAAVALLQVSCSLTAATLQQEPWSQLSSTVILQNTSGGIKAQVQGQLQLEKSFASEASRLSA